LTRTLLAIQIDSYGYIGFCILEFKVPD
jgi:hypothetical protein